MSPEFLSGIVVFGAEWCPKCKVLKSQLDKKGDAYAYVDVDAPGGKELADEHALRTLPAVFFKGKQLPADWRFINDEWKRFEAAQRLEGNPLDAVAQQELNQDVIPDMIARNLARPEQAAIFRDAVAQRPIMNNRIAFGDDGDLVMEDGQMLDPFRRRPVAY